MKQPAVEPSEQIAACLVVYMCRCMVVCTGAALHDNNDASERSYHPIWPPIAYVKVKCHFTAEIVRV